MNRNQPYQRRDVAATRKDIKLTATTMLKGLKQTLDKQLK